MATPHVAGVAALVWSYFPECTNHQIRMALIKTAEDAGDPQCDVEYGHGIVDALAAFNLLNDGGCDAADDDDTKPSPGGCLQLPENNAPTPAPTPFNCAGHGTMTLDLTTDRFGSETEWTVEDPSGAVQFSGSGYASDSTFTEHYCKDFDGCAKFTITDSFGDGICCSWGQGGYTITYKDETISGGEFEDIESKLFGCADAAPTPPPTPAGPVGCAISCDEDTTPWLAVPGEQSKCTTDLCRNCPPCRSACVQACNTIVTGMCEINECMGCPQCT